MNTPRFSGYVLAIMLSLLAFLLILLMIAIPAMAIEGSWNLYVVSMTAYLVAIVGTPVGAVGAAIVHLTCRHQPRQWVHVVAAGGTAVLIPASIVLAFGVELAPIALIFVVPMTLAAMVGRAAVIPLVPARTVHRQIESPATHMRSF